MLRFAPAAPELRQGLLVDDPRERRAEAAEGLLLLDAEAEDLAVAVTAEVVTGTQLALDPEL